MTDDRAERDQVAELTEDQLREMRGVLIGVLDFEPSDAELRAVWSNRPLVGLAHT